MIANYGYQDGSGDYYISVDSNKCTSCTKCVEACPAGVFEMIEDDYEDLVPAVTDEHRRKLKYSCMPCKGNAGTRQLPCIVACDPVAIGHSW